MKNCFSFQLSLAELGIIPGTSVLSVDDVLLTVPATSLAGLQGVEIFSTKVGEVRTRDSLYQETAYQVVLPDPPELVPRVLAHVKSKVCPGADPWDHLRLHMSVS